MKKSHLINAILLILLSFILTVATKAQSIGYTSQETFISLYNDQLSPQYKETKKGVKYIECASAGSEYMYVLNSANRVERIIIIPRTSEILDLLIFTWNQDCYVVTREYEWRYYIEGGYRSVKNITARILVFTSPSQKPWIMIKKQKQTEMQLTAILESIKKDLGIDTSEFEYICFTDGGISPINPGGEMTIGAVVVRNDGNVVHTISESIAPGHNNTNNIAEHLAMQELLLWFLNADMIKDPILVLSDSMLVVKYCKFICGMSDTRQSEIGVENQNIIKNFDHIIFDHIPRKYNYYADMLSTKSSKMQKMDGMRWTTLNGVKRTENYNKYVDELIKIYSRL